MDRHFLENARGRRRIKAEAEVRVCLVWIRIYNLVGLEFGKIGKSNTPTIPSTSSFFSSPGTDNSGSVI